MGLSSSQDTWSPCCLSRDGTSDLFARPGSLIRARRFQIRPFIATIVLLPLPLFLTGAAGGMVVSRSIQELSAFPSATLPLPALPLQEDKFVQVYALGEIPCRDLMQRPEPGIEQPMRREKHDFFRNSLSPLQH